MIQNNAVTTAKVTPDLVSSVDGVSNDGGNIDLVAGANITITPDDANNRITIAATAASGDNLGNHTATQNIKLNDKYLSNDGGNEGIRVYNDGHVDACGYLYSTSYIAAQTHLQAKDGTIRTGEPTSAYSNGDIAADDVILADDCVFGYGGGTSGYGVYGKKGSNYGYIGSSSYGVYGNSTSASG